MHVDSLIIQIQQHQKADPSILEKSISCFKTSDVFSKRLNSYTQPLPDMNSRQTNIFTAIFNR